MLVYAIGFVFFGVLPYFLLFSRTQASSMWLDVGLLFCRLSLAVLLSLVGWVITLGALTSLTPGDPPAASLLTRRIQMDQPT